jgi:vacuolar-type H+-ATPase subunit H
VKGVFMANCAKYSLSAVGHMFDHYGRQMDKNVNRSNKDIDVNRTCLNYNLAPERTKKIGENEISMSQKEILEKRLSEVSRLNRKDVNVMCDWVLTVPKDFGGDTKKFFESAYDFYSNRYGEDNVISAWVHMDETTPHMHFSFVPVINRDGKDCLCAKDVINKFELQKLHPALQEHLVKELGQDVNVLNGATAGGNLTILELKQRDLLKIITSDEIYNKSLDTVIQSFPDALEMMKQVSQAFAEIDTSLKRKRWFSDDDKAKLQSLKSNMTMLEQTVETVTTYMKKLQTLPNVIQNETSQSVEIAYNQAYEQLAELNKKANRRLKRAENALKRADEVAEQKLKQLLDENKHIIAEQQRTINLQSDTINENNRKAWFNTDYLRSAESHQNDFSEQIKEWSDLNASQNGKSNVHRSK